MIGFLMLIKNDMLYNTAYIGINMKINEVLKDLQLNWQTELQKGEGSF